jgi:hypothetical protein
MEFWEELRKETVDCTFRNDSHNHTPERVEDAAQVVEHSNIRC